MAFQVIPQSSFGSSVGSAIGKGLSEQLPKEIQRGQLASGLKNLGQQAQDLSPLEQVSKLVSIPGMDLQTAGTLIPYLQQLQARRALAQKAGVEQKTIPKVEAQERNAENQRMMGAFRKRLEASDFAMPKNDQQIYQRAFELSQINPNITEQEAISQAQAEDTRRVQSDQSLLNKSKMIEDEFNRLTNLYLQKEGKEKFGDIIGEMQGDYLEKARNRALDEGVSPLTAAKNAADDLLQFAKARQVLRTNRSALAFGNKGGDKVLKDIKNIRGEYEKRGQLENLRNDLINYHSLSPEEADNLAFPVSSEVKPVIDSLQKTTRSKLGMRSNKKLTDEQVRSIADKMTKKDSARSIALDLIGKGYDGEDFIEKLKPIANDYELSDRQKLDLTTLSERPSLGDIQLFGVKKLINNWRL